MAKASERNSHNVPGAWYVDSACIACGLCVSLAPSNFQMSDDGSVAYVFKQPAGGAEADDASSAMIDCPVEAIGNDG